MRVAQGNLDEAQVRDRLTIDSTTGDIYFNGVAEEGLIFVLTIKAQDRGQIPR